MIGNKIAAANHRDTVIVAVPLQHFIAKIKKRRHWEHIIFENYALRFMAEKPVNCTGYAHLASEILFMEQTSDLAWPINISCNTANFVTALYLPGSVGARTIRGDIKPWRPCRPYSFEYLARDFGSIKYDKQDRAFHYMPSHDRLQKLPVGLPDRPSKSFHRFLN